MGRDDSRDYTNEHGSYGRDERYSDERYDTGYYTDERRAYGDQDPGYSEEYSVVDRAMVLRNESEYLPALAHDEPEPVIIPGSGLPMGDPFIARRPRPLTMRIAVLTLMMCVVVTGLFAITPVGSSASATTNTSISSFQALSGAVVLRADTDYTFYTATWGDNPDTLAAKFNVKVGGIYKLNNLLAGEELTVGKTYKIPRDPNYGADYKPQSLYAAVADFGDTTYGNSSWTSRAGNPPPEIPCGPAGHGVPMAYQLKSPNPNSNWVRGFTWFHNGVDMSAPAGNPIKAAQVGEVIWAGWANDGFGFSVKINHCDHISTVYGHMQQILVHVHDVVQPGDTVGLEGSTGWSTGPHLHYMVELDNVPVDPMPYYAWRADVITGKATP